MLTVRRSEDRGRTRIDWLESYHSFSFGAYHDDAHMGFGPLRVINEDFVKPGAGFPTHGHRDMEIITYVLDGELAHKDNLGTGSTIRPGEVQMMRAGKGILHSEFNPSNDNPVHLLQIWIMPSERGLKPDYQQKTFAPQDMQNKLCPIITPDGEYGSLAIRQDAKLFAAKLALDETVTYDAVTDRNYWIQVARGVVNIDGTHLEAGDAVSVTGEDRLLSVTGVKDAEILLFDMGR